MLDQFGDLLKNQPLDSLPLWFLFLLVLIFLLLAVESGFRLGRLLQKRLPDRAEANVGALNGSTLALLAFLLAFVTSSAVNSFSDRRQAVVEEANAIGTAYLRAGLLPQQTSEQVRELLREYLDQRLVAADLTLIGESIIRSEEIQNDLWAISEELAENSSSPILALYISSINEVIDLHTVRINVGLVARLPWNLILTLFLMSILGMVQVGLLMSYSEKRNLLALLVFTIVLAVVFLLIIDLSRGQAGLFKISYQSLLDLQRQMSPPR
jgi:hypothetical protein